MMIEKMKLSKIAMKQASAMPGGSTVPWYICRYRVYPPYLSLLCLLHPRLDVVAATVEPPNKGHFGSGAFVLFSEVVLWWEVRVNLLL